MENKPFISIIIPTYNSEAKIERAIYSVLNQTYSDFEILIIDGKSKDNTLCIIETIAKTEKRLKFFSEDDEGIYDAMNKGIKYSNGEWLYFLGSDDFLYDNNVFDNIFKSENLSTDVIYGAFIKGEKTANPQIDIKGTLFSHFCHQSIFYKKKVLEEVGNYEIKYKVNGDVHLNLKLITNPNIRWKNINIVICNYAMGGVSANYIDKNFTYDVLKECKKYIGYGLDNKTIFICIQRYAFYHLKYFNLYTGLKWLINAGYFFTNILDIGYCLKVRYGFIKENIKVL